PHHLERRLLAQPFQPLEDFRRNVLLEQHPLDPASAVAQDGEQQLAALAQVVEPAAHPHGFAVVLADIGDENAFRHGLGMGEDQILLDFAVGLLVDRMAAGSELPRRSGQDRRARPAKFGTAGPRRGATRGRGETGWLARTQGGREPQRGSMPREDSRPTEDNARRPVSPRPAPYFDATVRELR